MYPREGKTSQEGEMIPLEAQRKPSCPTSSPAQESELPFQSVSRAASLARPLRSSRDLSHLGAGQTAAQRLLLGGGGQVLSEGPQGHLQIPGAGLPWLYRACITGVGDSPLPRGQELLSKVLCTVLPQSGWAPARGQQSLQELSQSAQNIPTANPQTGPGAP